MTSKVKASHILVKTQEEAQAIKEKIENGANFGEMAKQHSQCPSGKRGGDLGWFGHGQMVRPFEKAAFDTDKGKMSGIVKTDFGYHLILVTDKK